MKQRTAKLNIYRIRLSTRILLNAVLAIAVLLCVLPFVLSISISFSSGESIINGYHLIPQEFTLDAYRVLFEVPEKILRAYGVSFFVVIVGLVLNLTVTILVSYPLSIMDFRYRKFVSFFVFFTMMFSGGMISYYIMTVKYLGLKDHLSVLILPLLLVPNNVFLLRIFLQDVPGGIYESARLDGASEYGILFRIAIPLSKPGIATVALFIVLMYWNDYVTGMLFLEDQKLYPLQLLLYRYGSYLQSIKDNAGNMGMSMPADESILFAMCIVATLPMLFVFLCFQKYFVTGLTMGALKG